MDDTLKSQSSKIKKMTALMRKHGIKRLKLDEIEIELQSAPEAPLSYYKRKQLSKDNGVEDGEIRPLNYSEEDVLFWSSAQIPPEKDEQE